jgi:hypothetical protein
VAEVGGVMQSIAAFRAATATHPICDPTILAFDLSLQSTKIYLILRINISTLLKEWKAMKILLIKQWFNYLGGFWSN